MHFCRLSILATTVVGVLFFSLSCSDDVVPEPPIESLLTEIHPGSGVVIENQSLSLGDTRSALAEQFGTATGLREMGSIGVQFEYPTLNLTGMLSESGQQGIVTRLTLVEGFDGSADGIGIGTARTAVEGQYGTAVTDPFLGGSWYAEQGIGFEWEDDKVSRIHIFQPE